MAGFHADSASRPDNQMQRIRFPNPGDIGHLADLRSAI
jgi:hypothetical protein